MKAIISEGLSNVCLGKLENIPLHDHSCIVVAMRYETLFGDFTGDLETCFLGGMQTNKHRVYFLLVFQGGKCFVGLCIAELRVLTSMEEATILTNMC